MTSRSELRRVAAVNGEDAPEFATMPPAAPGGSAAGIPAVSGPPGDLPDAAPSPAASGDGAALKPRRAKTAARRPSMGESFLQQAVIDLCKYRGIWWYHAHQPQRDNPGFPDLVLIGSRGALFRELKTEAGRLSLAQGEVAHRMRRAGLSWGIWRPSDLQSGLILHELEGIR